MKDLKTYMVEGIKPPRLSAKNRDLWAHKPLVEEEKVMDWLYKNCYIVGSAEFKDGKINVDGNVFVINKDIEYFPYPFGEVTRNFDCSECGKLKSLKNCPNKVGGDFYCYKCGKEFTEEDVVKLCRVKGYIWI